MSSDTTKALDITILFENVVNFRISGKGKYRGQAGSLDARLENGVVFNVGSGLSDAERYCLGLALGVRYILSRT